MEDSTINIIVKPAAGGEKFQVVASTDDTIAELKIKVAEKCSIDASEQRLIYKGQVLKDERDIKGYGLESDHVIHLVKGRPAGTAPSDVGGGQAAAAAAASGGGGGNPGLPAGFGGGAPPAGMGAMFGGAGGESMPEQMASMMNSPMMQNMMNNPELLRSIFQSNPQIQQLMNSNPEVASMLNNPELLRDSLRVAGNPALMREQMRSTDRALSNIESHPEGFNMLRRMYENVQEPLMNAATGDGSAPANAAAAANPFAALFQAPGAGAGLSSSAPVPTSGAPNVSPLPNPWTPPAGAAAGAGVPPAGGFGGMGLPGFGGAGGMDLGAMMQSMQDPGMQQMMQNPALQATMQQMLQTPGMMDSMINSNPQLRSMVDANPQLRATLTNPEVVRQMMDPQTLSTMARMQQMMGGAPGTVAPGAGAAAGGMPDFSALMGMMGGGGSGAAFGGLGPAPVANPEETYALQIQQLVDMGFFDRDLNSRALQATGGNVNAAVERLLNS